MKNPWKITEEGAELFVKLMPNASRNETLGIMVDANEIAYLKISVTAIPENNKANQALIEFLSKKLKIAKSKIVLKSGATSTRKTLLIQGGNEALLSFIL